MNRCIEPILLPVASSRRSAELGIFRAVLQWNTASDCQRGCRTSFAGMPWPSPVGLLFDGDRQLGRIATVRAEESF